jgi:hypothetical protein
MADTTTYVKIDRNIVKWRWWKSRKTLHVFLWLLLSANIADHDFENETIHRGQVATSLRTVADQCCLTINEVRTTFSHLKSTGEITITRKPRYLVITIVQYDRYQNSTGKITGNSHANHTQITRKPQQLKNNKNIKNGKNIRGRSAPDSPSGKNDGKGIGRDEGTIDDIPAMYRDGRFKTYAEYWDWRHQ